MSDLFVGVDRALFVAALVDRLRRSGIEVPVSSSVRCAGALESVGPSHRDDLYWLTRLSFVSHRSQIPVFDAVFSALFDGDDLRSRPDRGDSAATSSGDEEHARRTEVTGAAIEGSGLPWATRPPIVDEASGDDDAAITIHELRPSPGALESDRPFDLLDEDELQRVGLLLETLLDVPRRRSRRQRRSTSGRRPELRATLRRARQTGGDPYQLEHHAPTTRARRLVVLVDVSGSMEPFTRAYLHLTRALVLAGHAEVFAFATELSRITPALRHRSPVEAIDRAAEEVGDRFGGTRLASNLAGLLRHPRWGSLVRGAVVVIASDGWDTDRPEDLARTMTRLNRLAHRVIWVNPRIAAPGYQPLVGAMAAALPHCDAFVSGHSPAAIGELLDTISGRTGSARQR